MFEFGNLSNTTFTSSASRSLKPFGIYEVTLKDISLQDIKGKKDPDAVFHVMHLEFEGEEGSYSQNLFIPSTEEDNTRPTYENSTTGHSYQRPSRFENYYFTLMQLLEVLNPTDAEKIKANGSKIKTIEQFNDLIIKALSKKNDVKTNIKLVGRSVNGTVYADLPRACGIDKEGKIFPVNFIGNNLMFNSYEQQQMDKYKNAKPTKMENEIDSSDDDLDIKDLADSL